MAKGTILKLKALQHEKSEATHAGHAEETGKSKALTRKHILELSHSEARRFFLKAESYCNFELPPYISFDKILGELDKALNGKNISDFLTANPRDFDDLNHLILNNKDGKYAWRPLRLMHPALYVSLVHKITESNHWATVVNRFKEFAQNPRIQCKSLPVEKLGKSKDKAEQVLSWWQGVEQDSIKLALDFEYLLQTDITDCYSAIYSHSIAWALHGKADAKSKRGEKALIGNIIDHHIQDLSHGQTNGIPQGSVLMDFIAEIVLGYADLQLSEKVKVTDYQVLRYRDDYRIFVNNPKDGEKIVKLLTEIMIDLGMKINPSKTKVTSQVVSESIKSDKLYWIRQIQNDKNWTKELLIIHELAARFPNSGSMMKALHSYHKRITSLKNIKGDVLPAIAIISDIACHNPRAYPVAAAILSKLLSSIVAESANEVLCKIRKRFDTIPNTGYLEIWLQRITLALNQKHTFVEPLCKLVAGDKSMIWNSSWLSPGLSNLVKPGKILNYAKLNKLTPVIAPAEVELFESKWDY